MKKLKLTLARLSYALIFVLSLNFANAQADINTSFSDRMNYIFQPLEKNRVPHGLLLDYAMEFTRLSAAATGAKFDDAKLSGFAEVTFRGAVAPAGADNSWWKGWTRFN